MIEYLSDAIILQKDFSGEMDARVHIFTKKYGKLVARAKSARKILSKLSAHLEPGNLCRTRLIEKNGLQVVDALKNGTAAATPADLHFLAKILAENEPEPAIWQMLVNNKFSWNLALKILGWDPACAQCAECGGKPERFNPSQQNFFCKNCSLNLPKNDTINLS